MTERIQKLLATAGVASRRGIEALIAEGRITVNGRPAKIGQKIDHSDRVRVDGEPVRLARKSEPARVLLYRKRVGEMVTRDDPEGRRTVFRKLPELDAARWIAIGRLDINTSGLLLLTTHGELARRLTHPSFEITREYAARVLGEINDETLDRLRRGVKLEDGTARFEAIAPMSGSVEGEDDEGGGANRWFSVTVREGRNRMVRRMFESQDLQVSRLIRVAYGPVKLGRGIKTGSYREATAAELQALMAAVKLEAPAATRPVSSKPRPSPKKRRR
jgi:23S rRNA pseudouridine2605 synthase